MTFSLDPRISQGIRERGGDNLSDFVNDHMGESLQRMAMLELLEGMRDRIGEVDDETRKRIKLEALTDAGFLD